MNWGRRCRRSRQPQRHAWSHIAKPPAVRIDGPNIEVWLAALNVVSDGIIAVYIGNDLADFGLCAPESPVIQPDHDARRRQAVLEEDVALHLVGSLPGRGPCGGGCVGVDVAVLASEPAEFVGALVEALAPGPVMLKDDGNVAATSGDGTCPAGDQGDGDIVDFVLPLEMAEGLPRNRRREILNLVD